MTSIIPNYWAATQWMPAAIAFGIVLLIALIWSWSQSSVSWPVRLGGAALKAAAIALLVMLLLEPMRSDLTPTPGANLFLILADDSQSMAVKDAGQKSTRAEALHTALKRDANWQVRLAQEFDTRRYVFDRRVRPVADFDELSALGEGSSLSISLNTVAQRYEGRPCAGMLLMSDGNATDLTDTPRDFSGLPPVYPVVVGRDDTARDMSITRVTSSQTNFEAAPVTVAAEIVTHGYAGKTIITELLNEADEVVSQEQVRDVADDRPFALRFQIKPQERGVQFYRVRAYAEGEAEQFENPEKTAEATLANNSRLVLVDRGGGPYRVLYVSGRPNWEFKFLRRSLADDEEVDLVGLVRLANREPKFTFRARDSGANPLFRGFDDGDREDVEQYDEPVLIRLGTSDEYELRGGFPKSADELFKYHAVVLDDVEAEFFTPDQKSLLQKFVSQRGGGFMMLGGQESFTKGDYARTPIGELLPVYADRPVETPPGEKYKLLLTREGWLQPWVRLRATEDEETVRLAKMAPFTTVNRIAAIKPGARVLAHVQSEGGATHPGLVVQPFGKGRTAALLVGDMWRWQLRRESVEQDDLQKSWRQTLRWLVADVPQRIEVDVRPVENAASQAIELRVKVHDESYRPLDNASVIANVKTPEGKEIELTAEPADETSGEYVVTFVPRTPGAYRAKVVAHAADASEVGQREAGWISEPATEEFRTLRPNRELLTRIADETGGEVIELNDLDRFVATLPNRKVPVTEQKITPVWHTWVVFMLAVGLLGSEWGLRRWKGMP